MLILLFGGSTRIFLLIKSAFKIRVALSKRQVSLPKLNQNLSLDSAGSIYEVQYSVIRPITSSFKGRVERSRLVFMRILLSGMLILNFYFFHCYIRDICDFNSILYRVVFSALKIARTR